MRPLQSLSNDEPVFRTPTDESRRLAKVFSVYYRKPRYDKVNTA